MIPTSFGDHHADQCLADLVFGSQFVLGDFAGGIAVSDLLHRADCQAMERMSFTGWLTRASSGMTVFLDAVHDVCLLGSNPEMSGIAATPVVAAMKDASVGIVSS